MRDLNPRLRMFAGPNGSGKSTLKNELPDKLIGFYLNADEIEQDLRTNAGLEFSDFGLTVESQEVLNFFAQSPLLKSQGLEATMQSLHFSTNRLDFSGVAVNSVNSYVASVAVDFLRHKLLEAGRSFTFETVMSHLGKVEFLSTARQAGFRIYLYYVATDDPAINISRVHNRVNMGGHDVPDDKVESRYYRSLELLLDAIRKTDRSYIFDNSSSGSPQNKTWLAEVTDGKDLELKVDRIPAWFKKYVLDKAND